MTGTDRNILLIDDDPSHARSLEDALFAAGDRPSTFEWVRTLSTGLEKPYVDGLCDSPLSYGAVIGQRGRRAGFREDDIGSVKAGILANGILAKEMKKKREGRGVALLSFFRLSRGKTYPMGVLALVAPEPEVSTRITPD